MPKLITILLIAWVTNIFGQSQPPEAKQYIPNYSPHAPNAAGMQKYADYQVNLATGQPDISLPIYTVREGKLSLPITLRYHAGGHKIDGLASWVGWGWTLDYGGSINRSINGLADDKDLTSSYLNTNITPWNLCDSSTHYNNASAANSGNYDLEPDLFSYSTPEVSGKYYLNQGSNAGQIPFLIPYQPVKITNDYAVGQPIRRISVEAPSGNEYIFGKVLNNVDAHEYQNILTSTGVPTSNGIVTWQLTKVLSPNTDDAINLTYQAGGSITQSSTSWSASATFYNGVPVEPSTEPQPSNQYRSNTQTNIHKIFFTNGELEFEQGGSLTRVDQVASPYLSKIKVYSYENGTKVLRKIFTFQYSYFTDRSGFQGRLKLDGITESDATETENLTTNFSYFTNNYSWQYNANDAANTSDLLKQDYFGYYNGISNNHHIDIANYNGVTILNGVANRSTVATYIKEGMLQKITYPTGGSTEFDFENNRYKQGGGEKLGGGARITSMKKFTSPGNLASQKRYVYSSSDGLNVGKLTNTWSSPSSAQVGSVSNIIGLGTNNPIIHITDFIGSNGLAEMGSFEGTPVYYEHVTEYEDADGVAENNGRTEYTFSFEPDVVVNTFISAIRDIEPWKRGNLLTKKAYDRSGQLIQSTTNVYTAYKNQFVTNQATVRRINNPTSDCGTTGCASGMLSHYGNSPGLTDPPIVVVTSTALPPCQYPEYIYYTANNKTGQLKPTQTTTMQDGVTTVQTMSYDDYLMPNSTTTEDSYTNHYNTQTTKYATDPSFDGDPIAIGMRSRQMIDLPLEVEESENKAGVITAYAKEKSIYATQIGTNSRGLINNILKEQTQVAPTGGSLETRVQYTLYDGEGNPLEYQVDGVPTSLLWGYGGDEVIATITNATQAQVNAAISAAGINLDNYNVSTLSAARLAELATFRAALPNSLVTWYTHIPHLGESQMVTPNGLISTFTYDGMQRLRSAKDHEGNLVATNQYHYGVNPRITSAAYRVKTTSESDSNDPTKAKILISHYDGLGRDLQKVGYQHNSAHLDIATSAMVYDGYGRGFKNYLPVPSSSNTGNKVIDPQAAGTAFYSDARPFQSVLAYDNSPLNREKETMGAGINWETNGKKVSHYYENNTTNEVRYYYLDGSNNIKKSGHYPAQTLYKKRSTDEENHETIELTDKRGRLIQKQQQDATGYITSYYIYDGAGRTKAIIQPMGYELDTDINYNSTEWNDWVFDYQYDSRGRLIEKKVPGAAKESFVYDSWDRQIMSQDGYQAEQGLWKFTKYDAFDRIIYSGIKSESSSRASLQAVATSATGRGENKTSSDPYYTLSTSYPSVVAIDIKSINYYDDYLYWKSTDSLSFLPNQTSNELYTGTKGKLTGSYQRNSIDNTWLKTAHYYDNKDRLIQVRNLHHLSGDKGEVNSMEYNFAGEILRQTTTIKKDGVPNLPISTNTAYDHIGRVLSNSHTIAGRQQNIASYAYDAIGRLQTKHIGIGGNSTTNQAGIWENASIWDASPSANNTVTINHPVTVQSGTTGYAGNLITNSTGSLTLLPTSVVHVSNVIGNTLLQKIDYSHHIRGGILGINLAGGATSLANDGDLFSYKLDYGFDGNIVKQAWRQSSTNEDRNYTFNYDASKRLTAANYSINANNFGLPNIIYDKNGNITNLKRRGNINGSAALMDDMVYTYSGNQITKITDNILSNNEVDFIPRGSNNYTYYTDGSIKSDDNEGISQIMYDLFIKQPSKITLSDGRMINYFYNGGGKLIRAAYSSGETWDYTDNAIYKNGQPYQLSTSEGRAIYDTFTQEWIYEFFIKDHLGNTRVGFKYENGIAVKTSETDFDPFQIVLKNTQLVGQIPNRQEVQGHESEKTFGLNRINFGYRSYNPTIGRWDRIDQVPDEPEQADKSPYAYVWNNPVKNIDPDGRLPIVPVLLGIWAVGEAVVSAYDAYTTVKTVADPKVPTNQKLAAGGGFILGLAAPGGGYGTAGKAIVKAGDKAVDAAKGTSKVVENAKQGKQFEGVVTDNLKKTGHKNVTEQVTIKAENGVKTRVDIISKDASGKIKLTEAKSSQSAPLTKNQKSAFPSIEENGGTVVGKGKPSFEGGTKIPPTIVDIVRPKQ